MTEVLKENERVIIKYLQFNVIRHIRKLIERKVFGHRLLKMP